MTVDDAAEAIEVGGFREWLPIPLDGVGEDFIDEMVQHFSEDTVTEATLRQMLAGLIGVGQQLADSSDDHTLLIGAWALLPAGGTRLELRGMLILTCQRVDEDMTPGRYIEQMSGEVRLLQPPDVREIRTKSGPAHLVRLRHHEDQHGSVDVSEIAVCFWLPERLPGVAVVMSTMLNSDLVVAADLAEAMQPLAESVAGL